MTIADASDSIMPFGLVPLKKLVPRGFFMEKENGRLDELSINHRSGTINQRVFEYDEEGNTYWKTTERYNDYSAINWDTNYGGLSADLLLKSDKYKELGLVNLELANQIKQKRMLTVSYRSPVGLLSDETMLLEPFSNSSFFKNIFTQNDRLLPVEFEFPSYESYNVAISIPEGYELLDFPESTVITIPSKGVKFNFQISTDQKEIKIYSRVDVSKSIFPVEEYPDLKFIMESIADKYMRPNHTSEEVTTNGKCFFLSIFLIFNKSL